MKYHDARELYADILAGAVMARELVEFFEQMRDRFHEAVMTAPAGPGATGVTPPLPPPAPAKTDPGFRPGDSARKLVAVTLALTAVGVSSWAGSFDTNRAEGATLDAADYLRRNDPLRAEVAARRANDPYKTAEALIRQGRLNEVPAVLRFLPEADPNAAYLRGLTAMGRGDAAAARTQYRIAEAAGDLRAVVQLDRIGRG